MLLNSAPKTAKNPSDDNKYIHKVYHKVYHKDILCLLDIINYIYKRKEYSALRRLCGTAPREPLDSSRGGLCLQYNICRFARLYSHWNPLLYYFNPLNTLKYMWCC